MKQEIGAIILSGLVHVLLGCAAAALMRPASLPAGQYTVILDGSLNSGLGGGFRAVARPAIGATPRRHRMEKRAVEKPEATVASGTPSQAADEGLSSAGNGASGEAAASAGAYVDRNFTEIRDRVRRHLNYPPLARKLGWHGQVVASFVVRLDGSVEKLKVVSTSGHDLLDQEVLRTIRALQPYPCPPVEAELILPVAYQLLRD